MQQIVWEGNTPKGHYQVIDGTYNGRSARVLYSGDRQSAQSGVPTDNGPDMLFDYNQRLYKLAISLRPARVLLIGGAVCTLPTALLMALPTVRIDVVEPDAGLTDLGRRYFNLPETDRLSLYHTDGRSFLAQHIEQYDLLIVDAYVQATVPPDLTTVQAFQAYAEHLGASGVFAMNIISGYHGPAALPLERAYAAAVQTFQGVNVFRAGPTYDLWLPQNFVLVAQKDHTLSTQAYMGREPIQPPEISPATALRDD